MPDELRTCRTCTRELPLTEFYLLRAGQDWRRHQCKDCFRRGQNANRLAQRLALHNMTIQRWEELELAQGGRCAICMAPGPLTIDHDLTCCPGFTSCGRCTRGLLCMSCLRAVRVWPDTAILRAAAAYVFQAAQERASRGGLSPTEEARVLRERRLALEAQRAADRNRRLGERLAKRPPADARELIRQAVLGTEA